MRCCCVRNALVAVVICGSVCSAAVYVGPGETYTTIQAGIDAAADGDTVIVRDGVYTGDGNRDIDFGGKAITVMSENGAENCIIDRAGFVFQNGEGALSTVDGFTITGSGWFGIRCTFSSPTISNNTITGSARSGIVCNSSSKRTFTSSCLLCMRRMSASSLSSG